MEHTNVLLEVAQNVRVDLTLSPGEQTQTVTVTEEAPAIDTTSSTLGGHRNQPVDCRTAPGQPQLSPIAPTAPGSRGHAGRRRRGDRRTTNGRREGADVIVVEGVNSIRSGDAQRPHQRTEQGRREHRVASGFRSGIQHAAEPSGGIWLEGRIGHKPWGQVGNQRHSWHGLCLRPRCGGDRCESILLQPAGHRIDWQLD